jgi:hypothetical protein
MVSDAVWADVRGDDVLELIAVGEWMPVTVFQWEEGQLVNRTDAAELTETSGWWNSVHVADVNGDGPPDLIAGNLGRNSRIQARPGEPARLYVGNFDSEKGPDPILTYFRDGKSYPHAGRDVLLDRFPFLRDKFPTYESFGASQIRDIFPEQKVRKATVEEAETFASTYLQNQGDGTFGAHPLPSRAQFAPIYGLTSRDVDGNGRPEVITGGNMYGVRSRQGRYDASYGTFLHRQGGEWTAMPAPASNLYLEGQVRALRLLEGSDETLYLLAARNDARPQVFRLRPSSDEETP